MSDLNGGFPNPQIVAIKDLDIFRICWKGHVFDCPYSRITDPKYAHVNGTKLRTVTDTDDITTSFLGLTIIKETQEWADNLRSELKREQQELEQAVREADERYDEAVRMQSALRKERKKFKAQIDAAQEMGERFKAILYGQPDKYAMANELSHELAA